MKSTSQGLNNITGEGLVKTVMLEPVLVVVGIEPRLISAKLTPVVVFTIFTGIPDALIWLRVLVGMLVKVMVLSTGLYVNELDKLVIYVLYVYFFINGVFIKKMSLAH